MRMMMLGGSNAKSSPIYYGDPQQRINGLDVKKLNLPIF